MHIQVWILGLDNLYFCVNTASVTIRPVHADYAGIILSIIRNADCSIFPIATVSLSAVKDSPCT